MTIFPSAGLPRTVRHTFRTSFLIFALIAAAAPLGAGTPRPAQVAVPQTAEAASPTTSGSAATTVSATKPVTDATTTVAVAPPAAKTPQPGVTQTLTQQIAALPNLGEAGIDVGPRGKQILLHLNAVLRYYRSGLTAIQKVGEPSDVLYSQQANAQTAQMAQYAFQSARNLAALLSKVIPPGAAPAPAQPAKDDLPAQQTEGEKLAQLRSTTQARIADLTAQDAALDKQIATTRGKQLPVLQQQDEQLEGQVELQKAMLEGLAKMSSMADPKANTGLAGEIDRLLRTAPELASTVVKPVALPVLESLTEALNSGVTTQAPVLFQLLSTRHDIDSRIAEIDALQAQASDMRTPMVTLLRSTIQQGDAAMQAGNAVASDAQTVDAIRKRYDTLTATFRVLATATLPMSQEIMQLEQSRANLVNWRTAVDAEYREVLRHLLLRVLSIGLALLALFVVSQVWKRLTMKYVQDLRRRRQLLVVRRMVLGFFSGLVVIFGFVTQFSSLATFAGFITAGIAVGLQTILLSVAAYFFIIGRFGVRVGDRITVAGVTGDVVDVGLVRFYMMELTGTGTELHPTGRVAVFANSVLFQAGTPLYKQMPGTAYAWHELTVKLNPGTDYHAATEAALAAVQTVYGEYQGAIRDQHQKVEDWMGTVVEAPHIEPRVQMAATGLQYAVLFPVQIKDAAITDEKIVHMLLEKISSNEAVKTAVAGIPAITAVIKG
jgi:small-conductance mechanosensitive channel